MSRRLVPNTARLPEPNGLVFEYISRIPLGQRYAARDAARVDVGPPLAPGGWNRVARVGATPYHLQPLWRHGDAIVRDAGARIVGIVGAADVEIHGGRTSQRRRRHGVLRALQRALAAAGWWT